MSCFLLTTESAEEAQRAQSFPSQMEADNADCADDCLIIFFNKGQGDNLQD